MRLTEISPDPLTEYTPPSSTGRGIWQVKPQQSQPTCNPCPYDDKLHEACSLAELTC